MEQSHIAELPLVSKNNTDDILTSTNHRCSISSIYSMSNDSTNTFTVGVYDIGNNVYILKIDDLQNEELLKTLWVPLRLKCIFFQ